VARDYGDLIVWQKAMDLVEEVYRWSAGFPTDERFGLTAQVRRAAVSVPSNIAEGQGRRSTGEFLQCLSVAQGSVREVETQVQIAGRLGYLDADGQRRLVALTQEVGRLLTGLANMLERRRRAD
jgi:four helix bundle protein